MQQANSIAFAQFQNFGLRIAKIFTNLSVFCLVLCLCGILSFVATAFVLVIGFTLIIVTIGTIFIMVPNYWSILTSATNISVSVADFFLTNWYYFIALAFVLSIISIVIFALDKQQKHTSRIVINSVIMVFVAILMVILLSGVV